MFALNHRFGKPISSLYTNGEMITRDMYKNINVDTIADYHDEIYVCTRFNDIRKIDIQFYSKNNADLRHKKQIHLPLAYHIAQHRKVLKIIDDMYWIPIRFIIKQTFENFANFSDYAFQNMFWDNFSYCRRIYRPSTCHILFKYVTDVHVNNCNDYYIDKSENKHHMYLSIKIYDSANIDIDIIFECNVEILFYQEFDGEFNDNLDAKINFKLKQKIDL